MGTTNKFFLCTKKNIFARKPAWNGHVKRKIWGEHPTSVKFFVLLFVHKFYRFVHMQTATEESVDTQHIGFRIPNSLREAALERMQGKYSTFSEYIRDLLRRDVETKEASK